MGVQLVLHQVRHSRLRNMSDETKFSLRFSLKTMASLCFVVLFAWASPDDIIPELHPAPFPSDLTLVDGYDDVKQVKDQDPRLVPELMQKGNVNSVPMVTVKRNKKAKRAKKTKKNYNRQMTRAALQGQSGRNMPSTSSAAHHKMPSVVSHNQHKSDKHSKKAKRRREKIASVPMAGMKGQSQELFVDHGYELTQQKGPSKDYERQMNSPQKNTHHKMKMKKVSHRRMKKAARQMAAIKPKRTKSKKAKKEAKKAKKMEKKKEKKKRREKAASVPMVAARPRHRKKAKLHKPGIVAIKKEAVEIV